MSAARELAIDVKWSLKALLISVGLFIIPFVVRICMGEDDDLRLNLTMSFIAFQNKPESWLFFQPVLHSSFSLLVLLVCVNLFLYFLYSRAFSDVFSLSNYFV